MLTCFICNSDFNCSVKQLIEHFKRAHGIFEAYARYSCKQGQCCRSFSNKYTFMGHLRRDHKADISDGCGHCDIAVENEPVGQQFEGNRKKQHSVHQDNAACWNDSNRNSAKVDITDLAARFICEAKSHISTLNSVHYVVAACKQMFEVVIDELTDVIANAADSNSCLQDLQEKLLLFRNPFAGIETEYAQTAYIERLGAFVRPESYVIGQSQCFVKDKVSGCKNPVMQAVTGQHVSIRQTLVSLHSYTDLVQAAIVNKFHHRDGQYETFYDGSHWKEHPLKDEDQLVLRLYGDDFEPANPLGSRKAVYKVGCIYFQLEGLPSYLLSRTENMFLTLCYHTSDVKQFGWEHVLRPLIIELKSLEDRGIELDVCGEKKIYRVIIGVFTGDNLFLNGILGYVESFVASFPCRQCHLHRNEFQRAFIEDSSMLRSIDSYNKAVQSSNAHETGIKQLCALNQLMYFHAATNYVQDNMHDLFEGVICYDIPLICRNLISKGFFDLSTLNHRIQNFDYGYADMTNKPPVISAMNVDMLPFDAAQMWCMCRILAVTVGDRVPDDEPCWRFYLTLRSIVDILVAPVVSDADLNALRVLVAEYLEMHTTLFPDETLKNKHHHLLHYERLIRKAGPMQRFTCIRFESKHQRCKKLIHISGNFKNVLKSCAFRHQHNVACRLLQHKHGTSDMLVGTGSVVTLSDFSDGMEINTLLGNVGMCFEVYDAKWIEVKGVRYKPQCIVVCGIEGDGPVLMLVEHILIRDEKSWFVGAKLATGDFIQHFHAWSVHQPCQRHLMATSCTGITYHSPLSMAQVHHNGEDLCFVTLRHRI